jgi:hypothetical protein
MNTNEFDSLKNIKKIPAPDHIYGHIMTRLSHHKNSVYSWSKVAAAAFLFLGLSFVEFQLFRSRDLQLIQKQGILELPNNDFYNE